MIDTPCVEWLNYHHLLYFWVVAKEGGLVPAGKRLRLSHPTLSAQIHKLEDRLGRKLFTKVGRKLVLTDDGKLVLRYAEEIFGLGNEMLGTLAGRPSGQPLRLDVGVVDAMPKMVVRRMLEPALRLAEPVRLVCREKPLEELLADLARHELDIVLADSPVPPGSSVRAFNHALGHCGVGLFAAKELARAYKKGFPRSLAGAPMLLPLENASMRRGLDAWLDKIGVRPRIVAELEDSALLKVFGGEGLGVFPAPLAVADEVVDQHQVVLLGEVEGVRERFYAISVERRLKHPAVVALTEAVRSELFGES